MKLDGLEVTGMAYWLFRLIFLYNFPGLLPFLPLTPCKHCSVCAVFFFPALRRLEKNCVSLRIDDTHRSRSVSVFLGDAMQKYLAKLVVSCVALVVLATCGMHTNWHRFYVLRTPVPMCPPAQS